VMNNQFISRLSLFISVTSEASMEDVYILIELVKLLYIYVLEDGKLTGVISRKSLLDRLKKRS
jgi:CBS domain-containing protein